MHGQFPSASSMILQLKKKLPLGTLHFEGRISTDTGCIMSSRRRRKAPGSMSKANSSVSRRVSRAFRIAVSHFLLDVYAMGSGKASFSTFSPRQWYLSERLLSTLRRLMEVITANLLARNLSKQFFHAHAEAGSHLLWGAFPRTQRPCPLPAPSCTERQGTRDRAMTKSKKC